LIKKHKNNCNYEDVVRTSKALLKVKSNHTQAKKDLFNYEIIQQKLREIQSLSLDLSKTAMIIADYDYIFQRSPNCIKSQYFTYLFERGELLINQKLCKEGLPYLIKAQNVDPSLGILKGINTLIAQASDCGDPCKEKSKFVKSFISEATTLFANCKYNEALQKYEIAKTYDCNDETKEAIANWQTIEKSIQSNLSSVNNFNRSLREADSLIIEGNCEYAIKIYKRIDTVEVNCEKLTKKDIQNKIVKAEKCIQEKCVQEKEALAQRSEKAGFYFDAIRFYCSAKECADTVRVKVLESKICNIINNKLTQQEEDIIKSNQNVLCVYCKPILIIGDVVCDKMYEDNCKKDSTIKLGVELVANTYKYLSNASTNYSLSGGIRVKLWSFQKKTPVDLSLGAFYNVYSLINGNKFIDLKYLRIPLGLNLHFPRTRKEKIRPYILGEGHFNIPLAAYSSIQGVKTKLDSDFYTSFSFGLGIEKHWRRNGLSFELYREMMKNNLPLPSLSEKIKINSTGVRLGVSFSK
jgi:tetratricopeptide (TPR) repeat protein